MSYSYRPGLIRKQDTAEYPVVTPERLRASNARTEKLATPQQHRDALAYTLFCTEMYHYGIERPAEWSQVTGDTRERFLKLAETALLWRQG